MSILPLPEKPEAAVQCAGGQARCPGVVSKQVLDCSSVPHSGHSAPDMCGGGEEPGYLYIVELQTKVPDDCANFYNHGEGRPLLGSLKRLLAFYVIAKL